MLPASVVGEVLFEQASPLPSVAVYTSPNITAARKVIVCSSCFSAKQVCALRRQLSTSKKPLLIGFRLNSTDRARTRHASSPPGSRRFSMVWGRQLTDLGLLAVPARENFISDSWPSGPRSSDASNGRPDRVTDANDFGELLQPPLSTAAKEHRPTSAMAEEIERGGMRRDFGRFPKMGRESCK